MDDLLSHTYGAWDDKDLDVDHTYVGSTFEGEVSSMNNRMDGALPLEDNSINLNTLDDEVVDTEEEDMDVDVFLAAARSQLVDEQEDLGSSLHDKDISPEEEDGLDVDLSMEGHEYVVGNEPCIFSTLTHESFAP